VSASCWDPARVLLTVHHEGNYCVRSWARVAKKSLYVLVYMFVIRELRIKRLKHELLRLPDSDPRYAKPFKP
jgi:hypothetical protein